MPLVKEDLDRLTADAAPCDQCGEQAVLFVAGCCRTTRVRVSYHRGSGVLRLTCSRCGRDVAVVAVADAEGAALRGEGMMPDIRIIQGDCCDVLPTLPSASFDVVLTDPPYPCIDRSYGRWTEAEWFAMMRCVVPECMRVLKPSGSAVFILQPNSERVGRMRTWLWEFMAWVGKDWGIVQDVYWWNHCAPPMTKNDPNLLRASVKPCVWVGPSDCYRNGDAVLWAESDSNKSARLSSRNLGNELEIRCNKKLTFRGEASRNACVARGGVTAFNLLPINGGGDCGSAGHQARTPLNLADWWLRYLCPPGGAVCDPFVGSGTVAMAAMTQGKDAVGIERMPEYVAIAERRIAEAPGNGPLFPPAQPPAPSLFADLEDT